MAADTTTQANTIREAYAPGFMELVNRNDSLLSLFGTPVPSGGDTAYRWKINSAGQTGEIFAENQPQPDPGEQTWVNAAVSYVYFRILLQFTGHLRDALRSMWINAIEENMSLGQKDLVDLITTTWMGSTYGMEVAIDSTSTYAGISRGSASYFESVENTVSGLISNTDLEDQIEQIEDNDVGGRVSMFIGSLNQRTNIHRITGQPFVATGGTSDRLEGFSNPTIAGRPAVFLPDWSNTVIANLDMSSEEYWKHILHRDWHVKEMAPAGDSDVLQLSFANAIVCKAPKYQGKLTSMTA